MSARRAVAEPPVPAEPLVPVEFIVPVESSVPAESIEPIEHHAIERAGGREPRRCRGRFHA
ncbi:MAG: hypothetical protein QUU85_06955 [Candidatus Eisenbacteria bacterium]|nr:hypothetical protein [Candidatus Eisenbacteria bacterium]